MVRYRYREENKKQQQTHNYIQQKLPILHRIASRRIASRRLLGWCWSMAVASGLSAQKAISKTCFSFLALFFLLFFIYDLFFSFPFCLMAIHTLFSLFFSLSHPLGLLTSTKREGAKKWEKSVVWPYSVQNTPYVRNIFDNNSSPCYNARQSIVEYVSDYTPDYHTLHAMLPAIPMKMAWAASCSDQNPTFLKRRLRACSSTTSCANAS